MEDRDKYYMGLARAVENGANCKGTRVGAIVVLKNRVVSTGYNGTPEGFTNCMDGGCVRCSDSQFFKDDKQESMSDPYHQPGRGLDRCICVHAEQNTFMAGARFGISLDGGTLYTTVSPCFGCLKEAIQVGIKRIVYDKWYEAKYNHLLIEQYVKLYMHLANNKLENFQSIDGQRPLIEKH